MSSKGTRKPYKRDRDSYYEFGALQATIEEHVQGELQWCFNVESKKGGVGIIVRDYEGHVVSGASMVINIVYDANI